MWDVDRERSTSEYAEIANHDADYRAEFIELATMGIALVTEIEQVEIIYRVVVGGEIHNGDRSGCRTAWQRVVTFGHTDARCAGGSDFVLAARLQQAVADEFVRLARTLEQSR